MSNKNNWPASGILAVVVLLSIVTSILLIQAVGKAGYLALETAKILFPTLIQVNTTLIGFWGIMFVYYLKASDEFRTHIYVHQNNLRGRAEKLYVKGDKLTEHEKKMIKRWLDEVSEFGDIVDDINKRRRTFVVFGIFVVAAFVSSILVCVLSLGRMQDVGVATLWVALSLIPLLLGVTFGFYGISSLRPEVPKKLEKPDIRKELAS